VRECTKRPSSVVYTAAARRRPHPLGSDKRPRRRRTRAAKGWFVECKGHAGSFMRCIHTYIGTQRMYTYKQESERKKRGTERDRKKKAVGAAAAALMHFIIRSARVIRPPSDAYFLFWHADQRARLPYIYIYSLCYINIYIFFVYFFNTVTVAESAAARNGKSSSLSSLGRAGYPPLYAMAERKSPATAAAIIVRVRGGSFLRSGDERSGEIGEDAGGERGGVTETTMASCRSTSAIVVRAPPVKFVFSSCKKNLRV